MRRGSRASTGTVGGLGGRVVAECMGGPVRAPADRAGLPHRPTRRSRRVPRVPPARGAAAGGLVERDAGPIVGCGRGRPTRRRGAVGVRRGRYRHATRTPGRELPVDARSPKEFAARGALVLRAAARARDDGPTSRFGAKGLRTELATLAATGIIVAVLGLLTPIMTGKILGNSARAGRARRSAYVAILLARPPPPPCWSDDPESRRAADRGAVDLGAQWASGTG